MCVFYIISLYNFLYLYQIGMLVTSMFAVYIFFTINKMYRAP